MSGRFTLAWLDPSEFMVYSCGIPPRSLTNATCWPVFGFQDGDVFAPFEYVSRLGREPDASERNSSGLPSMLDMNMSCEPSGDQDGEELVPLKRGQETRWLVSVEYTQICAERTLLLPGCGHWTGLRTHWAPPSCGRSR